MYSPVLGSSALQEEEHEGLTVVSETYHDAQENEQMSVTSNKRKSCS